MLNIGEASNCVVQESRKRLRQLARSRFTTNKCQRNTGSGCRPQTAQTRSTAQQRQQREIRQRDRQGNEFSLSEDGRSFEVRDSNGEVVYSNHPMGNGMTWGIYKA